MKKNLKKKVIIGNPPKAFVGMALMAGQAAMSIANGIKEKKELAKSQTLAQKSALTQQLTADQFELDEYPEEGIEGVNYYQAMGGIVDPTKKNKDLNKKEVKEINDSTGIEFDETGANALFGRTPIDVNRKPALDYGKYKKVGYFETGNVKGDTVRIRNTKANPHNASTIDSNLEYLRKINPGKTIELDYVGNYANGGAMQRASHDTLGGELKKVSSDMEIAEGNTHGSSKIDGTSGIKLIQGNQAIAEVEDDEMIKDGKYVYSDRLKASNGKTFAENAEKLARDKGRAEKKLGKGNSINRKTNERKVGMFDLAENALFMEQEAFKEANGIENGKGVPKAAWGLNLDEFNNASSVADKLNGAGAGVNIMGAVTPFIDNIANAVLTSKTPEVAVPSYIKARQMDTNVNVNPRLNAVDNAVNAGSKTMMDNTSNSNTARNNIASIRLRGSEQKADILAGKENQETQLRNMNTQFQQQTDIVNAHKRDQYNRDNLARSGQIRSEISANVSNMAGDFTDMENNKRDEKYNDQTLAAFKTAYGKNGIVERSDEGMMKWLELMARRRKGQ